MTVVVVSLTRVRDAVNQSARMGMPETQQTVVNRIVADERERQTIGTPMAMATVTHLHRDPYEQQVRRYVSAYAAPGSEGGAA